MDWEELVQHSAESRGHPKLSLLNAISNARDAARFADTGAADRELIERAITLLRAALQRRGGPVPLAGLMGDEGEMLVLRRYKEAFDGPVSSAMSDAVLQLAKKFGVAATLRAIEDAVAAGRGRPSSDYLLAILRRREEEQGDDIS